MEMELRTPADLQTSAVVTTVLALGNCKSVTDPAPCLDPWIGYLQKCFYFSENTTTWERSQKFCASHEATLVMVTTTQELDFLRRYSDSSQYWIGLSRQPGQVWRWVDGKLSTDRIKVIGVGEYAYLHRNGVGSASSHLRRKWICSRPASTMPRN
ncbi:C-type lectin domain family 2 member D-like [Thomomys bottae]